MARGDEAEQHLRSAAEFAKIPEPTNAPTPMKKQALVAMLLLAPKKARAFVASAKQQALLMLGQATHVGGTIAITGICGVLVPTSSSLTLEASNPSGLTQVDRGGTNTINASITQPSFVPEVAPEEPKVFDAEINMCSPSDMRCTKLPIPSPKT